MRRSRSVGVGEVVAVGDLVIDPLRRQALVAGMGATLTKLEFDLQHLLASIPGRVFRRNELRDRVWGRVETTAPGGSGEVAA